MRCFLVPLLALVAVTSALQCYVGWHTSDWYEYGQIPNAMADAYNNQMHYALPILKDCEHNEKCCRKSHGVYIDYGVDYKCSATCPDFEDKSEIVKEVVEDVKSLSIEYCQQATGSCVFVSYGI